MKFRTEVEIENSEKKIEISDKIFSIGFCFATEISGLLEKGQLQTFNNPFGTLFNPYSINNALHKIGHEEYYTPENLIKYEDNYLSLDHYSGFSSNDADKTLDKINFQIKNAHSFLKKSKWILITYGSSFVYRFLPKNSLVGNCHKIPQKFFEKKLMSHEELKANIQSTIQLLKKVAGSDVNILFTVSPVRHTKDGMVENSLSKAKLITAIHEAISDAEIGHYLPVYEVMMDDLRDYRFYKEDMIHPSAQAVEYIYQKFGNSFFADETMDFIEENLKIQQALHHQPKDRNHPKYLEFVKQIKLKIENQQKKVQHAIFQTS